MFGNLDRGKRSVPCSLRVTTCVRTRPKWHSTWRPHFPRARQGRWPPRYASTSCIMVESNIGYWMLKRYMFSSILCITWAVTCLPILPLTFESMRFARFRLLSSSTYASQQLLDVQVTTIASHAYLADFCILLLFSLFFDSITVGVITLDFY